MEQQSLPETEKPEALKNLLEVLDYLVSAGWKVSKSTVYRHRDEGRIRSAADGSFLIAAVEKYAKDFLKQKDGSGRVKNISPAVEGKQSAEARKVAAQAEHWEIKTRILKGEYVERAAFERALAMRATVLKSDGDNFIRTHAGEMINMVKGDSIMVPELIEFWLQKFEEWMARYSEDKEFELPKEIDFEKLQEVEA